MAMNYMTFRCSLTRCLKQAHLTRERGAIAKTQEAAQRAETAYRLREYEVAERWLAEAARVCQGTREVTITIGPITQREMNRRSEVGNVVCPEAW
jgi:hypothetical protein